MIARQASPAQGANGAAASCGAFTPGQPNTCPTCGGTSWNVGRIVAECAACGLPALLAAPPTFSLKGQ